MRVDPLPAFDCAISGLGKKSKWSIHYGPGPGDKAIHGHLPHAGVRRERRDRFAISFGILDIRREEILATCNRENSAGTRHGSQVHFDHESGAPSVALDAVPGSNLHFYQLSTTPRSAVQIIVGRGADEYRVYVHPQTARVLSSVNEKSRPLTMIFHLHGELLMGDRGSTIVELAASWAIVMIATGLFLWWPRGAKGFGGILYPRFRQGQRIFWRDLHAVTGVWFPDWPFPCS
jgi:uncharacterized iron-regulated membrane protein